MCDLPHCDDEATNFVLSRPLGVSAGARPKVKPRRFELCPTHYKLALALATDNLTKILDHGPLYTGLRLV